MGGGGPSFKKPLGNVGSKVLGKNTLLNTIANKYAGVFTGQTVLDAAKAGARNVGEGLGEITGSNALRKQAMDQQQAAEEAAKREAALSDAMARNAGGDATNIFLASGKRGKKGGGGGTGSAGTGSSRETGVQS